MSGQVLLLLLFKSIELALPFESLPAPSLELDCEVGRVTACIKAKPLACRNSAPYV